MNDVNLITRPLLAVLAIGLGMNCNSASLQKAAIFLKGCPTYSEEVAFPPARPPVTAVAAVTEPVVTKEPEKTPEPVVAAVTSEEDALADQRATTLDNMYNRIRQDIEATGVKLEDIESGFRAEGLSVEKVKSGPTLVKKNEDDEPVEKAPKTRELLITVDGDISFKTGSAALTPAALALIDKIAAALAPYPDAKIKIGGHTDTPGSLAYNLDLSKRRAQSVKTALVTKHNIAAERVIEARGYADKRKLIETRKAEPRNRRVEIRVVI